MWGGKTPPGSPIFAGHGSYGAHILPTRLFSGFEKKSNLNLEFGSFFLFFYVSIPFFGIIRPFFGYAKPRFYFLSPIWMVLPSFII